MGDRRAVVIGGGITGALTARELAERGWEVTVLEGAWIGAGSSSRTAAGIRQQFSTPETVRGMRWCVRFYLDWRRHTGSDDVPIVQNGYLFLYDDDEAWAAARVRVEMQRGAGLSEVEALDAGEVRSRWSWVAHPGLRGGTWCPTDGFLHPEVVYQDAIRRARELGARVVQKAPVEGASHAGDRIAAVHTPKGRFEGDLFFDCTNAWTRRTAAALGAEELPVDPLKRYLWFLKRGDTMAPEVLAAMPLTILPSGIYIRPENEDTLLMGRKHAARPEVDFSYEDQDRIESPFGHEDGIDAVPFELWMEAAASVPALEGFEGMAATTSGYYGTTPDHNPFLGYDRVRPNLVRLVGFSGHGAMFGPFTARVAGELADAGGPIEAVELDGERVGLAAFAIGRDFTRSEAMVI